MPNKLYGNSSTNGQERRNRRQGTPNMHESVTDEVHFKEDEVAANDKKTHYRG